MEKVTNCLQGNQVIINDSIYLQFISLIKNKSLKFSIRLSSYNCLLNCCQNIYFFELLIQADFVVLLFNVLSHEDTCNQELEVCLKSKFINLLVLREINSDDFGITTLTENCLIPCLINLLANSNESIQFWVLENLIMMSFNIITKETMVSQSKFV